MKSSYENEQPIFSQHLVKITRDKMIKRDNSFVIRSKHVFGLDTSPILRFQEPKTKSKGQIFTFVL